MQDSRLALRARLVLPICGPPIVDGIVTIAGAKIVEVANQSAEPNLVDLGDVALLPGLVNAHTHLEFSDLSAPLGEPGSLFPEWIREVIEHRRGTQTNVLQSISQGLTECLRCGTTTVGEIATTDWRANEAIPQKRPTAVVFHEAIGPSLPRAKAALATAEAFLNSNSQTADIIPALSPHAPYTVHPRLLSALVELSQKYRTPVAMHLAESREELELLTLGSGPFREMLESVGAWNAAEDARLSCVLDYLTELARAERALVIHGNYLDSEEMEFLANHAASMSVVYCPRTHAFFEHEPYSLSKLLGSGVSLALGTDSRASSPDLSLLEEAKLAASSHPDVPPAKILELATLGGAQALGLAGSIGSLEAGKRADIVSLQLPNVRSLTEPESVLLSEETSIAGVWIAGARVL